MSRHRFTDRHKRRHTQTETETGTKMEIKTETETEAEMLEETTFTRLGAITGASVHERSYRQEQAETQCTDKTTQQ